MTKLVKRFCLSAGFLLLLTGGAKLASSFGHARALWKLDPILRLDYQHIFWIVGTIEVMVGAVCFLSQRNRLKLWLIAALATNFILYRLAAIWVGVYLCPCLGSLTQVIPLPGSVIRGILWAILIYLSAGSYTAIFYLRQTMKPGNGQRDNDLSASATPHDYAVSA